MSYLIDSDESINYLKRRRRAIELIDGLRPQGVAVSIITYAEIYDGVYGSRDRASTEEGVAAFISEVTILPLTLAIARRFAAIRQQLRREGNLIPDMDLFIAATAIEHDLTLVTGNRRHFDRVPGLALHNAGNS